MDPALFQKMQEAALRFRSGQTDVEEIMTPNGLARLVRDPANELGFRIDFVGEGAKHSVAIQNYPPSATRPPGYPAPLPFLEHCHSTIDTLDQSVSWRDPADPQDAFRRVAQACLDDGWTERPTSEPRVRVFHKDGAERRLRLSNDPKEPSVALHECRLAPT